MILLTYITAEIDAGADVGVVIAPGLLAFVELPAITAETAAASTTPAEASPMMIRFYFAATNDSVISCPTPSSDFYTHQL